MALRKQSRSERGVAIAVGIILLAADGGCARLQYGLYKVSREVHQLCGSDNPYYFHSPHTGEIMPRGHGECPPPCDLPYFGYEATCWHRWPPGWTPCPCETAAEEMPLGAEIEIGPSNGPATGHRSEDVEKQFQ